MCASVIGCNIVLRPQDSVSLSSCAQIAAREAAHQWSLASLRGRACGRPPRWQPAYALGRHTDVGHWDLSPEWFGTQAGGWGRGAGEAIFQQQSELGNGEVGGRPVLVLSTDAASAQAHCQLCRTSTPHWRTSRLRLGIFFALS